MADNFALANRVGHLIVQPADLELNPPESYLFVQDGLIISCGVIYALCYLFIIFRAFSDRALPGAEYGSVQFFSWTMAYEAFYAIKTTTTNLERLCFFAWFVLDFAVAFVVMRRVYTPKQQRKYTRNMVCLFLVGLGGLEWLSRLYPDPREQITAYWAGLLLQLPIGFVCLWSLWQHQSTKGHSLEIWLTKYIGCYTAYGVFFWRYWNVPQNWGYVGSTWSIGTIVLTLIPETIYPFYYVYLYLKTKKKLE